VTEALARNSGRWLVISYTSDWLFPAYQSRELVDALAATNKPVSYCNVVSDCGHDAFLLPNDLDSYGELMRAFLADLSGGRASGRYGADDEVHNTDTTHVFHPEHPKRLDYDVIIELIPTDASVLDLGCGNGALLDRLHQRAHRRLVGIELDEKSILACVRRGLDVIQHDLNDELSLFADRQFDYVVLSQTLQAVRDVERVVDEMLRVGGKCIVSFPNFAYHRLRNMLAKDGRAPEASGLLRYKWYNTPNLRFFSIADFEDFCREKNITVHRRLALDTEADVEIHESPNLNADLAIFVLSR